MPAKKIAAKSRTVHPAPFRIFPFEVQTLADAPEKPRSPASSSLASPLRGESSAPKSILAEAAEITAGDRHDFYGHPADNHGCTAKLWGAYLSRKLRLPVAVSAADVCMLNILQKISRQAHCPKRDNLVDVAGYAKNADDIETGNRARLAEKLLDSLRQVVIRRGKKRPKKSLRHR